MIRGTIMFTSALLYSCSDSWPVVTSVDFSSFRLYISMALKVEIENGTFLKEYS